jgi:endonuclease-3
MDPKRRSEVVRRRLEKIFGRPENDLQEDPLSSLVRTILSQNTTDATSERAWESLRKRYPTMTELKEADPDELAETIRVGGLARLKAERILNALREIERLTGKLSLDFLKDMSEEDADAWLAQLKGVGPKTRAIVLLFALRKKAFPVDTHILRVTKRLGLIGPHTGRLEAQRVMAGLARPQDYFSYHLNLIEHGRRTCSARRPKCGLCVLFDICPWSEKERYAGSAMTEGKEK